MQEKARLATLSADMARVSKENSALVEELARLKAARAVTNTAIPAITSEEPKGDGDVLVEKPPLQLVGGGRAGMIGLNDPATGRD